MKRMRNAPANEAIKANGLNFLRYLTFIVLKAEVTVSPQRSIQNNSFARKQRAVAGLIKTKGAVSRNVLTIYIYALIIPFLSKNTLIR